MSSWGKNDAASNAVFWAAQQLKKTANSANRDALYGNTTANGFVDGLTTGMFAVDPAESKVAKGAVPHTGWVLRTEGSGGRAGRVFYETLVAGGIPDDGSDDAVLPDAVITIGTQPSSASANASADAIATFTVSGSVDPTGSITYVWQKWGGSSFSNLTATGAYSNVTTATLAVLANTAANGEIYRVGLSSTGATTVYSSNAVLTVTT